MNNTQFKRAISEALTKEYELSVPAHNNDHEFSDKFARKMDKLIGRRKKPYYQMINTAGKRVACIFAVIFIAAFTTIMSVSALRNAFKDFFMSIFSDHSEISANVESNEAAPDTIQVYYDLSDYDVIYEEYDKISRNIIYQKENTIIDYQQLVKSEFDMGLNTESAEISTIDISGHDAVYYVDNHQFYHLIWDNGDYIIMIGSNIGRNELIDIANSVQKAEK